MEDFIIFTVVFVFGYWLGQTVTRIVMGLTFQDILKDLGVTNQQLRRLVEPAELPDVNQNTADGTQLTPLEIVLEQDKGVLYAYRKDTRQFLGQGTDQDLLIEGIARRMTNVRLIIDSKDAADLLRKSNG
jgi:hypothetical protein